MAKDYYLILGVGADATLDEIKSAYRREAKIRHPDHSGEDSEPFLALREAYEVLCDPCQRQAYDAKRTRERQRPQSTANTAGQQPPRRSQSPAEPLVPTQRASSRRTGFVDSPLSALLAELFGHPWNEPPWPARPAPGSGVEHVRIDVSLSREEARYGGRLRLWVPAKSRCPSCHGWGEVGFYACRHCLGRGTVVDEHPVDIAFPGGLIDGAEGSVSLQRSGLPDLTLVLRFRIDPQV
jgi:DnaJ-class molecular chaperone